MTQDQARRIAEEALGWLAGQGSLCEAFLTMSGAEAGQLRAMARDPSFLSALLDFILQNDAWVLDCAQAQGVAPERLLQARAVLGAGDLMHWT